MYTLKFNIITALLMCASMSLKAEAWPLNKELTKEITETFDVGDNALLTIENKYGDINISTWDKKQIEVDVKILVKSGSDEKAQKFLDGIEINFSNSTRGVKAVTEYPDQDNSSWWSSWWGSSKNIKFEVHYTIKAPSSISVDLLDKYGNIALSSITGDAKIENKYGDISAKNIGGDLDVDLGYGKSSFGDTGDATVTIKYGKFFIDKCDDLRIESKYSAIKIGYCKDMTSNSKYDDFTITSADLVKNVGKYDEFKIKEVGLFDMESKHSDVEILTMNRGGIFDVDYGDIIVLNCSSNLEKIDINAKYSDFEFDISSGFTLDFSGDYTDLDIDMNYDRSHYDKSGSSLEVKGSSGNGATMIKASMKYGELNIE